MRAPQTISRAVAESPARPYHEENQMSTRTLPPAAFSVGQHVEIHGYNPRNVGHGVNGTKGVIAEVTNKGSAKPGEPLTRLYRLIPDEPTKERHHVVGEPNLKPTGEQPTHRPAWEPWGDEGWQRSIIELKEGETAPNPASTSRMIFGPIKVKYVRAPDGGIGATELT